MKKYVYVLFLILIFLLAGCSSDDGPNDSTNSEEFPEYNVHFVDISVPANIQNRADEGDMAAGWAVMIVEMFESVNSFGDDYSMTSNSANSLLKIDRIYTREYNVDGVTITQMQEITDDYLMGEVTLNGTQQSTGFVFNNWVQSEIMCLFSTYDGYFKSYFFNTTTETVDVEWTQETSDLIKYDFMINDGYGLISFNGEGYYQLSTGQVTLHFTMFDGTYYDMRFRQNGTGEYTHWASEGGTVLDEGTW